jgi:hypothetical protein
MGGNFREAYAVSPGDWVLVRPDGYIGAIVGSPHLEVLMQYLDDHGPLGTNLISN